MQKIKYQKIKNLTKIRCSPPTSSCYLVTEKTPHIVLNYSYKVSIVQHVRQTDRRTNQPTDIVTYRAAIAAKNWQKAQF